MMNTASPLRQFISAPRFPCVMAKALLSRGRLEEIRIDAYDPHESALEAQAAIYDFIDRYRREPQTLSSFTVSFGNPAFLDFGAFEEFFWKFLEHLSELDGKLHPHDPRVDSDPESGKFSYSLKGEAFFILVLHPESPRLARRHARPTVVFNAHQQFETLRAKGLFARIRDTIRKRDFALQGSINPMLDDYGRRSEAFQYLGREYPEGSRCPFRRLQRWWARA